MVLFLPVAVVFFAASPWLGLKVDAAASLRLVVFIAAGGGTVADQQQHLRADGLRRLVAAASQNPGILAATIAVAEADAHLCQQGRNQRIAFAPTRHRVDGSKLTY